VLGGDANHKTARPLRLRIRIHIVVKDNQKINVTVGAGVASRLRAIDDESFEPVPIEVFKRLLGVIKRASNRTRKPRRGGHGTAPQINVEDG
jgi:hypothetical protein